MRTLKARSLKRQHSKYVCLLVPFCFGRRTDAKSQLAQCGPASAATEFARLGDVEEGF